MLTEVPSAKMVNSPNYSRIAGTYYERYEANPLESVAAALRSLVQATKAKRILEVGCGTGRWVAELEGLCEEAHGVDPSAEMLEQARKRCPALRLSEGRAEELPFRDAFFDLVYCVNAVHHFEAPRAFISEAHRLLGPGGVACVIGFEPHGRRGNYYVYRFFEGTYERDLERFPRWAEVLEWMEAAGFQQTEQGQVARILDHQHGREVLKSPFLKKNACSQLALLTDEAYTGGLRRIEAALVEAERRDENIVFPVDLPLAMLTGRKKVRDG